MIDRGRDLRKRQRDTGSERRKTDDGRRCFVASEAIKQSRDDSQGSAEREDVARVVVVANCENCVIERGRSIAKFGFDDRQVYR
ncbi:MAG: hypothetical protein WAL26_27845 [Mycobacterium sp.]